jgi:Uma2 family endonuclease
MSPTQTITELIVKSHAFFDAGVKSYWLVIPSLKTIYVFSDKGEYEVYAKTDKLIDNQLNIEMDLGKLFSKK